jgi:hypothetical protein
LNGSHPNLYAPRTLAEVIEAAKKTYPATVATVTAGLPTMKTGLPTNAPCWTSKAA